jgi:hypothetical protein
MNVSYVREGEPGKILVIFLNLLGEFFWLVSSINYFFVLWDRIEQLYLVLGEGVDKI